MKSFLCILAIMGAVTADVSHLSQFNGYHYDKPQTTFHHHTPVQTYVPPQQPQITHSYRAPDVHYEAPINQYVPPPSPPLQQYLPPVQHYEPAPVQHYQPVAPVQHYQSAPVQHYQPAPIQHYQPAPVQHYQPAPVHHYQPAPVQQTYLAPVVHQPLNTYIPPSAELKSDGYHYRTVKRYRTKY